MENGFLVQLFLLGAHSDMPVPGSALCQRLPGKSAEKERHPPSRRRMSFAKSGLSIL